MTDVAYTGADIHDGQVLHHGHALMIRNGTVACVALDDVPDRCDMQVLDGGIIMPGFVDLQVNGGGGVMFNDDQSVAALRRISTAHAQNGTTAFLPTLITDTADRTAAAIDAVIAAMAQGVTGIAGLHLEGPHLSIARKGAHDAALIRPMTDDDLRVILDAALHIPNIMVTVAPENTSNAQIAAMADAGVVVSLGHTDADNRVCHAAFDAGASCVTHLFNAMSQLGNRETGLVGATLERGDVYAGLIADGIHVDAAAIRISLAAKPRSDRIFLVSDAMATAGSDIQKFMLNGRDVFRKDGRLTLAGGTLAGADLTLWQAISVMADHVGDSLESAIKRATSTPASLLRDRGDAGTLQSAIYISKGAAAPSAVLDGANGIWSSISRVTSDIS